MWTRKRAECLRNLLGHIPRPRQPKPPITEPGANGEGFTGWSGSACGSGKPPARASNICCLRQTSPLPPQERALHARPVVKAPSADFDVGQKSLRFPVAQSATADWQPRQQLLLVNEASLAWRTVPGHVRAGRRQSGSTREIVLFTVHKSALRFIRERAYGNGCDARCITSTGFQKRLTGQREEESVHSICPIASLERTSRPLIEPQGAGIRRLGTYRFSTGQALPLSWLRILCPCNRRGDAGTYPGEQPLSCPQPQSVRGRSGTVASPRPQPCPRIVCVTAAARPWQCPRQARRQCTFRQRLNTGKRQACPRTGRGKVQSTPAASFMGIPRTRPCPDAGSP